jgi:creatinine amidohydrolase/Fe(II)-dependent formamide hydrolase-like protein
MMTDHAAENETSLMMALYGGFVDLSQMPADAPSPAVWGPDPRRRASAAWGTQIAEKNVDMISEFLLKLKETLVHPRLHLDFHHVKDATKKQEVN